VKTIEAVATTSGSPAAVWALLADASKWPRWGSWSKVEVEGGGPQKLGAVRVLVKSPYDHAAPLAALVLRLAVRDARKRLAKAAAA
jgi:hypothetical protein